MSDSLQRFRYIAIEGPIGVGKSSLARRLAERLGADLLQADPATLMQRVRRRGIAMEQGIGEPYLRKLCDAYVDHFRTYRGPLFAVVTEGFNPVDEPRHFERLFDALAGFEGPHGLFDPRADTGVLRLASTQG